MTLGDYLTAHKIKPTDFAARVGVTPSIITRLIRRERGVSLATAIRIEDETSGAVTVRELEVPRDVQVV